MKTQPIFSDDSDAPWPGTWFPESPESLSKEKFPTLDNREQSKFLQDEDEDEDTLQTAESKFNGNFTKKSNFWSRSLSIN